MAASAKGSVSPPLSNSTNSTTEASSQINNTRGTASKRKAIPLSHKGDAIGLMIEKCLLDWGIDKLFTVTVDNATSNDVAIGYLRKRFSPRGGCIANGLKEMNKSVARVRGAVKYVRQSPARLKKFMEYTAEKFERAFERFEEQDTNFRAELELGEGWPTVNDWTCVRNLRDFLEHFYEVTLRVSGTSYVTSNNFFDELTEICILLRDVQLSADVEFSVMAMRMKDKFEKYWGDIEKMNMLVFVGCVLDPRQKLSYLEFALNEMYDSKKSFEVMQKLKETLNELYDEYKSRVSSDGNHLNVRISEPQQKVKRRMKDLYKRRVIEIGGEDQTSELDK
ncbi:zinc finger BED domain-containing protein RICESLEEPER 2-like [Hibiscus syriacus]|uniref:zinc finger BED domain-containing protein RICESLEEPER 2-like n=1 Tax=Hibiscus syriacus TaxID=106335 RepID=UPI0019249CA1|nr:zinc finger BED domain-containing protein RICESLEEPER 2-like [Hibiscus syriacus]